MTSEHPNAELTRRVFGAFGKDAMQISAALCRDIVWRVPGSTVMSGEYRGRRAVEAGVFGYLVKPFREKDLVPAIAAARARHDELQAVREEAESLQEALAARKVIERAKGLLMETEGLTEAEAFDRLRRASQTSQRPLKVIAEAVVATLGEQA